MLAKLQRIYAEFPQKFWIVVAVSFIDRVGGTLLFPFFSLYITQKFGVGMTEAGIVLGLFAIFGLFGGMIGGALTDRFGRRKLILFGLIASAISTLALGTVNQFALLIPLAVMIGLLSDVAGPAHAAMLADILDEKQRQEGFGILRVVGNLAWLIGPSVGGFIAGRSFFALFVIDAVVSCIVAFLFYRLVPETKPELEAGEQPESVLETFKGYRLVAADRAFMAFLAAAVLMGLVYGQMYSSLSVYLRDNHGVNPQGYGFLMTTSAIVVILLQFWVSRRIKTRPPFLIMAAGTLFYLVGFGLFGIVATYGLFVMNMVIITLGEMLVIPTSQTLAANFSSEDTRGRYMAMFGLMWMIPSAIGPSAAGLILDNYNPDLLWYVGAGLCAVAALAFLYLHLRLGWQKRFKPAPEGQTEAAPA